MSESSAKADLHRYLQYAREALLWKLDGLTEYDVRRPLVPTGTNLLGLVKHLAYVELGYFGVTFGRPSADRPTWGESDPNGDMFATPGESRDAVTGLYRRAWAHADATIEALALDAAGRVPWWPADRNEVTLHHILVRVATETSRHAGHADIVRELIDGATGLTAERPNPPPGGNASWQAHHDRVERAAREAASDVTDALGARNAAQDPVTRATAAANRHPEAAGHRPEAGADGQRNRSYRLRPWPFPPRPCSGTYLAAHEPSSLDSFSALAAPPAPWKGF